jgi:hypothetical protein
VSPFRYIFKQAGVQHPAAYSVIIMVLSMFITMAVCIKVTEHAIHVSERGQCQSLQADVDAYLDEPPITASGWNQLRSKQARLRQLGCPVPKD